MKSSHRILLYLLLCLLPSIHTATIHMYNSKLCNTYSCIEGNQIYKREDSADRAAAASSQSSGLSGIRIPNFLISQLFPGFAGPRQPPAPVDD
jgi:hypothetical protein